MGGEDLGPLIRGEGPQPVPLSALFGNPHRTQAHVSPDGRWISFLAPSRAGEGKGKGKGGEVMNVWVVERHRGVDGEGARMVTHDRKRGIREHFWSENSRDIVYLQDGGLVGWLGVRVSVCLWAVYTGPADSNHPPAHTNIADGDENWHLFKVCISDVELTARDLTPFEGVRAQNVMTSRSRPDEILVRTIESVYMCMVCMGVCLSVGRITPYPLPNHQRTPRHSIHQVGLNLRSRAVFDVHRINLATGACVLDTENPGDVITWHTDRDFVVRAALAADPQDGGKSLRVRDAVGGEWRTVQTWGFEETAGVVRWNAEGDGVYVTSSVGSDTARLVELDAKTGEVSGWVDPGAVVRLDRSHGLTRIHHACVQHNRSAPRLCRTRAATWGPCW